MSVDGLKAGIAQVDVSPPVGVQLQGYPYMKRENTGIHDPLYADCLVLSVGQTSVALITTDLVFFEKSQNIVVAFFRTPFPILKSHMRQVKNTNGI